MAKIIQKVFRKRGTTGLLRPALALFVLFAFCMGFVAATLEQSARPSLRMVHDQTSMEAAYEPGEAPALISHEGPSLNQARDRAGKAQTADNPPSKFCSPFLAEGAAFPLALPAIRFSAPCAELPGLLPGPDGRIHFALPPPSDSRV